MRGRTTVHPGRCAPSPSMEISDAARYAFARFVSMAIATRRRGRLFTGFDGSSSRIRSPTSSSSSGCGPRRGAQAKLDVGMPPAQLVASRRQVPSQMNAVREEVRDHQHTSCAQLQRSGLRRPATRARRARESRVRRSGRSPEPPIGPPARASRHWRTAGDCRERSTGWRCAQADVASQVVSDTKKGPGRPGWSPTQAPHRSRRAR